jgi:hypothetical protein
MHLAEFVQNDKVAQVQAPHEIGSMGASVDDSVVFGQHSRLCQLAFCLCRQVLDGCERCLLEGSFHVFCVRNALNRRILAPVILLVFFEVEFFIVPLL